MKATYDDWISRASVELGDLILVSEGELTGDVLALDKGVLELVRRIGKGAVAHVLNTLVARLIEAKKSEGYTIHRNGRCSVRTVVGIVEVTSPYLRHPVSAATARPAKDSLGLSGVMKTPAIERALTDFGAEESFANAAKRFEEHYGQEVGRTSVLRVVEGVAQEADKYVSDRLEKAKAAFEEPLASRPGTDRVLVELDGSMVRTGRLLPAPEAGRTEVRKLPKRHREEAWREARVGFARAVDEVERTYVARMDSLDAVAGDLFGAAVDRGLSDATRVFAVADGGNGLREALDAQFSGLTFLLDRPHLKSHIFQTADARGIEPDKRAQWVADVLGLIDAGDVADVIEGLKGLTGQGADRARQLAGFLSRYQDALGYIDAYNQGLPLGSGEIESAHRYIPQKRLKLPGTWWSTTTVQPMLALRVLRANGWWADFWRQRRPSPRAAA